METKEFKTNTIGKGTTFIVGFGPGKQRRNEQSGIVWEGNKSGDIMQEIIKGKKDLFLTNAQNVWTDGEITDEMWEKGFRSLQANVNLKKPKKILAFGGVAAKMCHRLKLPEKCEIVEFVHPSYIVRFNKDRDEYIKAVKETI